MGMNLAKYDLVSIRLALLCAQTGSLSAATRQAHCSLSAGSQRLSALEDALGTALFIRDHRGLQPTRAGKLFAQHAGVILGALTQLSEELSCVAHEEDAVRARCHTGGYGAGVGRWPGRAMQGMGAAG